MWAYSETLLHFRERVGGFEQTAKREGTGIETKKGKRNGAFLFYGKKLSNCNDKPPTEIYILVCHWNCPCDEQLTQDQKSSQWRVPRRLPMD